MFDYVVLIALFALLFVLKLSFLLVRYVRLWGKGREERLRLYDDPDLMEQEVERLVALGSSIGRAKGIMEANGFECRYAEDSSFIRGRDGTIAPLGKPGESTRYEGKGFLYCDFSGFAMKQWLPIRWHVAIAHEERIVTIIAVSAHVIYL